MPRVEEPSPRRRLVPRTHRPPHLMLASTYQIGEYWKDKKIRPKTKKSGVPARSAGPAGPGIVPGSPRSAACTKNQPRTDQC